MYGRSQLLSRIAVFRIPRPAYRFYHTKIPRPAFVHPINSKSPKRKNGAERMMWPPLTPERLNFGEDAGYLLRHGARKEGYLIRPDGYMRAQDVMRSRRHNGIDWETFQHYLINDPPKRFQLRYEPDLHSCYDDNRMCWWVRAKEGHSIQGVDHATRRILRVHSLPRAVYKAHISEWDHLKVHGIPQGSGGLITLSPTKEIEENTDPIGTSFIYIIINVEEALRSGVDFYLTRYSQVLSLGDPTETIPPNLFKDVVEVRITKESLK